MSRSIEIQRKNLKSLSWYTNVGLTKVGGVYGVYGV